MGCIRDRPPPGTEPVLPTSVERQAFLSTRAVTRARRAPGLRAALSARLPTRARAWVMGSQQGGRGGDLRAWRLLWKQGAPTCAWPFVRAGQMLGPLHQTPLVRCWDRRRRWAACGQHGQYPRQYPCHSGSQC